MMNFKDIAVHREKQLEQKVERYSDLLYNAIVLLEEQGYSKAELLEEMAMTEKEYDKIMGDD